MDSILFDMGVSFVLTAVKAAFKSAEKKADLKKVLLKVRNQINALYFDDPDFQ